MLIPTSVEEIPSFLPENNPAKFAIYNGGQNHVDDGAKIIGGHAVDIFGTDFYETFVNCTNQSVCNGGGNKYGKGVDITDGYRLVHRQRRCY